MTPFGFEMDTRLVLLNQNLVPLDPRWSQQKMCSGYWRLYVHDRDGAFVRVGDRRFALGPGRVHLIPAWMTFDYGTRRRFEQFYAGFDLVRWTARVTRRLAPGPVSLAPDAVMAAAWESVRAAHRGGAGQSLATRVRVKALVHASLAAWMDTVEPGPLARGLHAGDGRREVEPALAYIDGNLGEPLGNDALAGLCHYSTDHFARVFRRVVGQTPARYVAERRVAAAAQALAFTDRSIDDIALSLGFANRFYFSRAFKRHLGTPPAAYRDNVRVD